jgi:hypothetical protein
MTAEPFRHVAALTTATAPSGRPLPLGVVVVAIAAVASWMALGGVMVSTLAAGTTLIRRQPSRWPDPASRLAGPRWLQRAVLGACGVSMLSPVAADAAPAPVGCLERHHDGGSAEARAVRADVLITGAPVNAGDRSGPRLTGLALPDLPNSGRWGAAIHIVRSGDSLWNIVHERLPALASEAVINRHVQALYRANRDVIGTDPDLIYPGTPLVLPGGKP